MTSHTIKQNRFSSVNVRHGKNSGTLCRVQPSAMSLFTFDLTVVVSMFVFKPAEIKYCRRQNLWGVNAQYDWTVPGCLCLDCIASLLNLIFHKNSRPKTMLRANLNSWRSLHSHAPNSLLCRFCRAAHIFDYAV